MLITFLIKLLWFFKTNFEIFSVKIWSQCNLTSFFTWLSRVDLRIVADDASKISKPRATQSLII